MDQYQKGKLKTKRGGSIPKGMGENQKGKINTKRGMEKMRRINTKRDRVKTTRGESIPKGIR